MLVSSTRRCLGALALAGWMACAASPAARACANDESLPAAPLAPAEPTVADLRRHESRAYWLNRVTSLRAQIPGSSGVRLADVENSLAVALMHLGQAKEAVTILRRHERERPGRYQTAANLGTALELSGDNADALFWIREGIRRDPASHQGSEWLHVRILQAKIALSKDPKWLASHTVLSANFGSDSQPHVPIGLPGDNTGNALSPRGAEKAIVYQLHERLQFVSPPDPVVADVAFDLANLIAVRKDSLPAARDFYALAHEFGPARADLVRQRLDSARGKPKMLAVGALALATLGGVGLLKDRRGRRAAG